jgi:hypothetical protein
MEISIEDIAAAVLTYIDSGRSIVITDPQERQGNSKRWEKDFCEYLHSKGYSFDRRDDEAPDFGPPMNLEVKTLRFDRPVKTFSIAPLTAEEAATGILPYRILILIWKYDSATSRGLPVDAVLVPHEAKTVLTNWSYKGIQVKSGISDRVIREKGLLAGRRLPT